MTTVFNPLEADIVGRAPRYQVDYHGNFWSTIRDQQIKTTRMKNGYLKVKLFDNLHKHHWYRVARLVAECFVPNPDPVYLTEVDHIDFNIRNNHYTNLRWVSRSQSSMHRKAYAESGKKGVYKSHKRYMVQINIGNRKRRYMGTYDTIQEASDVYNRHVGGIQGEFAVLNP